MEGHENVGRIMGVMEYLATIVVQLPTPAIIYLGHSVASLAVVALT